MVPFKTETTINRPVDQVFRFVADPQSYPKWMGGLTSATLISESPTGVGTKVRVKGRSGPWNYDGPMEITDYAVNQRLGLKATIPGAFEFEGRWVFEPKGDSATLLTASGEYRLQGLWKLIEPLMAGEMRNGEAEELKKIKSLLEDGG